MVTTNKHQKVFVHPSGLHSRAMVRVAKAIGDSIPKDRFTLTVSLERADIIVLHVIGLESVEEGRKLKSQGKDYIVIQYCGCWDKSQLSAWYPLWKDALFVWSYYDLSEHMERLDTNFYFAPLGVDKVFTLPPAISVLRQDKVLTSGYVSHPSQEPIEEVWKAVNQCDGLSAVHLGPQNVAGMSEKPANWQSVHNVDDQYLVALYHSCKWVAALRHFEGFELPAIEGLACGARPICFDQPSIRYWYGDLVEYAPDCHGQELVEELVGVLTRPYRPVTDEEKRRVSRTFNWDTIMSGFWSMGGVL
jgi:hypothetical protein